MKKPVIFSAVGVLALCLIFVAFTGFSSTRLVTQQVQANLLQNGSFENDAAQLGTSRLQGWNVVRANVDVIPNNAAALWAWHQSADGAKSLELTGNPGAATIEQSFSTEVGRKYIFSGWVAHHYGIQQAGVNVLVNGVALEPLNHSGQATQSDMKWQSFTREFEARSVVTTLRLEDRNLANWPWGGAVLDGLAVRLVPLPQNGLLQNGSFENSPVGLGLTSLAGWEVIRNNVDVIPNNAAALWAWHQSADGVKSLELTGNPGAATIRQTFPTEIGRKYIFSGWIAHHYGIQQAGVNVSVNGELLQPLYHSGQVTQANMKWEQFTREFMARSSFTTLTLEDRNLANWGWGGAILDGLSIKLAQATPSPAPTGTLCGAVLLKLEWALPTGKKEFPAKPGIGLWIKVGSEYSQAAKDGIFTIERIPTGESKGYVYKNQDDKKPIWEFPLSMLSNTCNNLTPIIVEIEMLGLSPMDTSDASSSLLPSSQNQQPVNGLSSLLKSETLPGCALWQEGIADPIASFGLDYRRLTKEGKTEGCCQDYNNPLRSGSLSGDGVKYKSNQGDHCETQRILNWDNSTCYKWSSDIFGFECWNEQAYRIKGGLDVIFGKGPSCWENHKYRNCQQMNPKGFSIEIETFNGIVPDQEVINIAQKEGVFFMINITNTTPSNHTLLQISNIGEGKFMLIPGTPELHTIQAPGRYFIPQYIENIDSPFGKINSHLDKTVLMFIGPELKQGNPTYRTSFFLEAYGLKRTINVTVTPPTP